MFISRPLVYLVPVYVCGCVTGLNHPTLEERLKDEPLPMPSPAVAPAPNHLNPNDRQPGLHASVRDGNVARVRLLLAAEPDLLNATERSTKLPLTPLQTAAQWNQLAAMKALIELGADPQAGQDGWWGTPLQIAAYRDHREAAELLLTSGAPLDIYSAVALDKRHEVERLLRAADVFGLAKCLANSICDWPGRESTPLVCVALAKGHTEMAEVLLRYGADPNAKVITKPCFISDINGKGVTVGLTPAGTFTPDLDVPVRKP